ncbi:hypothetical protein C8J57DRAFT_1450713 [Mycena rebaudengoi]|nr:hypothetical protein C8J57DRAFT_1450713 [Mycena rebaudengoi]
MARAFYISGMVFLFFALVLSFLSSISTPYLPALDFVRVNFGKGLFSGPDVMTELRFGIWGPCIYDGDSKRHCEHKGHGYTVEVRNQENTDKIVIGASWTRGLAIHPVATGVIAIAFGFAVSKFEHAPLIASLTSFFAALILLIAFAIDIALYAFVHHEIGKLSNVRGHTTTSSAFWMTFVSLILVLLAGCTVCFGRRKESGAGSYPMMTKTSGGGFLSRFRK